MSSMKLMAGEPFPKMTVQKFGGGELELGVARGDCNWQLVVVYRGKHCPLCTKYLAELEELKMDFINEGVDLVIVSADPESKAKIQLKEKLSMTIDAGIELSIEQMQTLGLYISNPRSEQENDRPFAEPGLFVVNENGNLHVVDISNNPFVRPDLKTLLSGLKWIRDPENHYPIRGTYK